MNKIRFEELPKNFDYDEIYTFLIEVKFPKNFTFTIEFEGFPADEYIQDIIYTEYDIEEPKFECFLIETV